MTVGLDNILKAVQTDKKFPTKWRYEVWPLSRKVYA